MKKENAFNWDIKEQEILDMHGKPIKGYKEIKRDDNDGHIAVMKKTYHPMTTKEFSETAHSVAEAVGCSNIVFTDWETSSKNLGRSKPVVTAELEISKPLEIAGSKVEGLLTIGVGFDGSRSFFIGHKSTYLRCSNEFNSIIKDFTSRLTKNHMVRVEEIIKQIELYHEFERRLYENFENFQKVKIDETLIQECVDRVAKLTDEEKMMTTKERHELLSTQKLNKIDDILASVRGEVAELGNNAWALFNGITHYTTHVMPVRGAEGISSLFGAKAEANKKAYNFGLELLEN